MGKVLITGVNGYIGRRVALDLAKAGCDIHGVSLEPDCFASQSNIGYTQGDITDTQCMRALFENNKFDAVVHLAALVHVRSADNGFDDYSRVNFRASETIFQLGAEFHVPRVMFASTVEVYGPTAIGAKITEDAPCKPESDYARAKLLAEQTLVSIAHDTKQAFAIMRFAPVYGPGFRLNLDKRLYLRPCDVAFVMGTGKYCLHFCAVQNIIKYIERWLEQPTPPSGIFNIADDTSQDVWELLRFERKNKRARFTLRIPYVPSVIGAALWQASNALLRRPNGMLSIENFSKLVRSACWDNTKARAVAGDMPSAFESLDAQNSEE